MIFPQVGVSEKLRAHPRHRVRRAEESSDALQSRKLDPEAGRDGHHAQVQASTRNKKIIISVFCF